MVETIPKATDFFIVDVVLSFYLSLQAVYLKKKNVSVNSNKESILIVVRRRKKFNDANKTNQE